MRFKDPDVSPWWVVPVALVLVLFIASWPPSPPDWENSEGAVEGFTACKGRDIEPEVTVRPGLSIEKRERALVHETAHAEQMRGRFCRIFQLEMMLPHVQLNREAQAFCVEARFAVAKKYGANLEAEVKNILSDFQTAKSYSQIRWLSSSRIESVVRRECGLPATQDPKRRP